MSALGAISGNGVYSELEYKGKRFKISQWFNDAMDAVSDAAFIKAGRVCRLLAGTDKELANRETALARSFALGAFSFSTIIEDGGLDADNELLATFLFRLIQPNDSNVTFALAYEMVENAKQDVIRSVNKANPRIGQQQSTAGEAAVPGETTSAQNG